MYPLHQYHPDRCTQHTLLDAQNRLVLWSMLDCSRGLIFLREGVGLMFKILFFLWHWQCTAGRVFEYRVGYWTKYQVAGRVRVQCRIIRSGISRYLFYSRVFLIFRGISGIFGYFWVYPYILRYFSNIY